MALVVRYLSKELFNAFQDRDTRLDHLPFTSPLSVIMVLLCYGFFIGKIGPALMKNQKPFVLNNVIIVYDLIQIALNIWLFVHAIYNIYWYRPEFNFACQPTDWGTSIVAIKEAMGGYYYYCFKLLDLIDTVFFILRKKNRQISFLHVYHHIFTVIASYLVMGWSPGGHFIIVGLFNSIVHTFMYSYYCASIISPELKENVAVKKFVTKLQIIQFFFLVFFFGRPLFSANCAIPKLFLSFIVLQNIFLAFLFADFYYKNYNRKNK